MLVPQICTGCDPHSTLQNTRKVGADVTKHVWRHHYIVPFWVAYSPHAKCIDECMVSFRIGIIIGNFMIDAIEQLAAPGYVGFVDTCNPRISITRCTVTALGGFECKSDHSLASGS